MEPKERETKQNLLAAFAGESQACNKYTYFATAGKEEGFEQIVRIFLETAENERNMTRKNLTSLRESETPMRI